MGTPSFAATILEYLLSQEMDLVAVYTQADKPVGRKQELQSSAVKLVAQKNSAISIEQPLRWNNETIERLRSYRSDLIIVAAYGKILPKAVIDMPRLGCVNIHASLLPRWRGASPVQNAILAGDETTGVTLMLMDEHMDTGPILAQESIEISETDTTPSLLQKLSQGALSLLEKTLPQWIAGSLTPQSQDDAHVTLCQLIDREDGRIFWNESPEILDRKFRALTPWPGLFFFWRRTEAVTLRVKLLTATFQKLPSPENSSVPFGTVFLTDTKELAIRCDQGRVLPSLLQVEGKKPLTTKEFLSGYSDFLSTRL
jgi:methionyl-tRNA formyltransferase